jgi:hypothetical protein
MVVIESYRDGQLRLPPGPGLLDLLLDPAQPAGMRVYLALLAVFAAPAGEEVSFGVAEAGEFVGGQVDAAAVGILAEVAHSGLDLVAAIVTLIAVRLSGRPADQEHTYGHGKIALQNRVIAEKRGGQQLLFGT